MEYAKCDILVGFPKSSHKLKNRFRWIHIYPVQLHIFFHLVRIESTDLKMEENTELYRVNTD